MSPNSCRTIYLDAPWASQRLYVQKQTIFIIILPCTVWGSSPPVLLITLAKEISRIHHFFLHATTIIVLLILICLDCYIVSSLIFVLRNLAAKNPFSKWLAECSKQVWPYYSHVLNILTQEILTWVFLEGPLIGLRGITIIHKKMGWKVFGWFVLFWTGWQ